MSPLVKGAVRLLPFAAAALLGLTLLMPAASASSNPAAGETLTDWHYVEKPQPTIEFDYGPSDEPLSLPNGRDPFRPKGGYQTIDAHWGGFDNPAPLIWYTEHACGNGCDTSIAAILMGKGVKYAPDLIKIMNAEHFSPGMIGAPVPKGITTPAQSRFTYADGWIYPEALTPPNNGVDKLGPGKAIHHFGRIYVIPYKDCYFIPGTETVWAREVCK